MKQGLGFEEILKGLGLMGAIAPIQHQSPNRRANVSAKGVALTALELNQRWVVSPAEAHALIASGATVLDARNMRLQRRGVIPGSVAVSWRQFSQATAPHQGQVLADLAELGQRLQAVGVRGDRPVIVLADPLKGWGEDGRMVWMLRSLGHPQAVLVDGGYPALVQSGIAKTWRVARTAAMGGTFVPQPCSTWTVDRPTLRQRLTQPETRLIDARTHAEFFGATPHGERRGGHIPGAIHLDYRELLTAAGRMRSPTEIYAELGDRGIDPSRHRLITYCTGGIRSGWLTAVLTHLGIPTQNYPGSMWDWAAAPVADYPLCLPPPVPFR